MEERFLVDNKHGSPSHINLYILSDEFLSGTFSYEFYQTDGQPYYSGAATTPLIFYTRAENLKQVKKNEDGSYIYHVTFGVENGKYVFANNFCSSAITLTPGYRDPRKESPIATENEKAYFSSYAEYPIDISDESKSIYCSLGDDAWIKEHLNSLIEFAKEHDAPDMYVNQDVSEIDTSDIDELRQALQDTGHNSDLLDEFLDELASEEVEENDVTPSRDAGLQAIAPDENQVESIVSEQTDIADDQNVEPEEVPKKYATILSWAVTIFFLTVFMLGCIWQRKRKQ